MINIHLESKLKKFDKFKLHQPVIYQGKEARVIAEYTRTIAIELTDVSEEEERRIVVLKNEINNC